MKKIPFIIPLLVLVSSCGKSSSTPVVDPDYYVVTFAYNNEAKAGDYTSLVVMKDQPLEAPSDPNIVDQVFEGWYKDPECTKEYLRFGLEVSSSFTLYAKWSDYEDLDLRTQVSRFQDKISELGLNAIQVNQDIEGIVSYPALTDQIMGTIEKRVYKRYKDILTIDYSYLGEDEETYVPYGVEQVYHEGAYVYDIYNDFEDATANKTSKTIYNSALDDTYYNVDFITFSSAIQNSMVTAVESGKYAIGCLDYLFTGNYTALEDCGDSYVYSEYLSTAVLSEEIGDYATTIVTRNVGLRFENKKIKNAIVTQEYAIFIGEDCYQYNYEECSFDFFYNDSGFPTFTGEKLSH